MQHLKLEGQEERNEKRWSLQASDGLFNDMW